MYEIIIIQRVKVLATFTLSVFAIYCTDIDYYIIYIGTFGCHKMTDTLHTCSYICTI